MWYQRTANKFGAKKTVWNGRKYDSKHEATVAQELELEKKAKLVKDYTPQVTFPLHGKDGTRVCDIRVDFLVDLPDGTQEVREAKSPATMTAVWHLKRKLFECEYRDIKYVVVTNRGNWYARTSNAQSVRNNIRSARGR